MVFIDHDLIIALQIIMAHGAIIPFHHATDSALPATDFPATIKQ